MPEPAAVDEDDSLDPMTLARPGSAGCWIVLISALVSCLLLFLNGGVVMALINMLDDAGWQIVGDTRFTQFVVLIGPVVLLVIQWMMIDYLRNRLFRTGGGRD